MLDPTCGIVDGIYLAGFKIGLLATYKLHPLQSFLRLSRFRLLSTASNTRHRCRASAGGSILSGFWGKLMLGRSLKQLTPKQLGDEDNIDEDVRAEADRVVGGGADGDVVKVRRSRASTCLCVSQTQMCF